MAVSQNVDDAFSRFDTIHACDRQTDGQTDGIGVAYTRYSIYAVVRKNLILTFCEHPNGLSSPPKSPSSFQGQKVVAIFFYFCEQTNIQQIPESQTDNKDLLAERSADQ